MAPNLVSVAVGIAAATLMQCLGVHALGQERTADKISIQVHASGSFVQTKPSVHEREESMTAELGEEAKTATVTRAELESTIAALKADFEAKIKAEARLREEGDAPALASLLFDKEPQPLSIRRPALEAIAKFETLQDVQSEYGVDPSLRLAAQALVAALGQKPATVRAAAAAALGNLSEAVKPHIPNIIKDFRTTILGNHARQGAAMALGALADVVVKDNVTFEDASTAAVKVLETTTEYEVMRVAAAKLLGRLVEVLPERQMHGKASDWMVRPAGVLGETMLRLSYKLRDTGGENYLEKESDEELSAAAAASFAKFAVHRAFPYTMQMLVAYMPYSAPIAFGHLAVLSGQPTEFVKILEDRTDSEKVAKTLNAILMRTANVIPDKDQEATNLVFLLKNKSIDMQVRFTAAVALGALGGEAAKGKVNDIRAMLNDTSAHSASDHKVAAFALGRMAAHAESQIEELTKVAGEVDEDTKMEAIAALVSIALAIPGKARENAVIALLSLQTAECREPAIGAVFVGLRALVDPAHGVVPAKVVEVFMKATLTCDKGPVKLEPLRYLRELAESGSQIAGMDQALMDYVKKTCKLLEDNGGEATSNCNAIIKIFETKFASLQ